MFHIENLSIIISMTSIFFPLLYHLIDAIAQLLGFNSSMI